jgi:hypothetical protein
MPSLRGFLDRLRFTREGRRAAAARRYLRARAAATITTKEISAWAAQIDEAGSVSHPNQILSSQEIIERVASNALPVEEDQISEPIRHSANDSRNPAIEERPVVRRYFEQLGDGSRLNWTSNDYMAAYADAREWHQYDAEINPRPRPPLPPAPASATNDEPPAEEERRGPLHFLEEFDGEVYTLAFWWTDRR